ncbi:cbb3-type cytochrome oxidase assembly protein CcoS [Roseospira marina]|uniref:Cbb3-type cytochrome oxidase assembly protein CcoS n=1 Tax=Roseospira marina TaxID=140057 RepID=A0A5M6IH98_9PROT|nr:cbb3-type cytochrome oxidase assembly protein CcoS [Roseospira marina]KAA5607287.1 cbb3-type cytochrome oxidase assembly protein CcoS [Roseospira marina]MBB4312558.1 cbb3-type cytochrome oxidase maturation protein [Roseospira marina]MBB5085426.1 cbb3-type cytochrome oxidase maturation protein [Roseospira marina]
MNALLFLIPLALLLGLIGLAAFLWALKSGQFDDLDGAAHRILFDDDDDEDGPGGQNTPPPPSRR